MGRNLLFLFMKHFIPNLVRGIGFAAIMLISTMFAVFRGIWEQSGYVADGWRSQMKIARWDDRVNDPMYWIIRIVALLLMVACLVFLSKLLTLLVEQTLRL